LSFVFLFVEILVSRIEKNNTTMCLYLSYYVSAITDGESG